MNKWILILLCSIGLAGYTQEQTKLTGKTTLNSGFYHLGSYGKERPSIGIEQLFNYHLNQKWVIGMGLGFTVYPAAFTLPISAHVQKYFKLKEKISFVQVGVGQNLRVGENTFSSFRQTTSFGMLLSMKKFNFVPELGYSLLLDKWGGVNLSFTAAFGLQYKIF